MVPAPPVLADVVDDWNSRELFWIVKHGIKYTAMPAWSTQRRDDEVWAMVAFLQQLPRMEAPHYRELALGPLAAATAGAEGARISTMELPPLSARDAVGCGLPAHRREARECRAHQRTGGRIKCEDGLAQEQIGQAEQEARQQSDSR